MTRELQIASNIQSSMLPVTPNQENMRHQVDVKVKLLSANDISADFYDYLYVGHSMVFCLGDVPHQLSYLPFECKGTKELGVFYCQKG